MKINGVVLKKLSNLDRYLNILKQKVPSGFNEFKDNIDKRLISERLLQILIEIIIDIADRIISIKGWGPSETSSGSIEILFQKKILKSLEPYISMIKFRNFIVYNYNEVNPAIVYKIIKNNLIDFTNFKEDILSYVDSEH